jgi:uncharacterized protein (DUF736 family)
VSYDNTNRGALFKNGEKETDNHPDYRGDIDVNGVKFWLSAWIKESKKGMKYMSLSIKPKLQSDSNSPPTGGRHDPRDPNDEIPF